MGLFSIFTGDAAEEAANKNRDNLTSLKKEGMGYLDTAHTGAFNSLGGALASWNEVNGLGNKYNAAGDMYLNALGLNGAAGNDAATSAFRSSPGYDFKVSQSLDALDRRAASRGLLGSGNNSLDTLNVVHGLADQDYSNWLSGLSNLTNLGAQETNIGRAGTAQTYYNMVPVYQNEANNRINLASGVTQGINNANTQEANAEMQASGNLWGLGLNLAKLGVGSFGGGFGGTSNLGGMTPAGYSSLGSQWYNS